MHKSKVIQLTERKIVTGIERLYLLIFHWTQGPFSMKYYFYTV